MRFLSSSIPRLRSNLGKLKSRKAGQRILVLDDDPVMLMFTSHSLQKQGFSKIEVTTLPSECIEKVKSGNADILLLDYRIPPITGADVAREITLAARQSDFRPPKMFAVTTNPTDEVEQDCYAAGISEVLKKPFCAKQFNLALGSLK